MEQSLPVAERPRRPEWMKVRAPSADSRYFDVKKLIHGQSLHTICEEARCPNIAECWGRGTATFQILGDTCTRACRYCYVHSGRPEHPPDPLEPLRLAQAAAQMELEARRRHVGRPGRPRRPRRRPLRRHHPRAQAQGAGGLRRGAHARLPRRRGGGPRARCWPSGRRSSTTTSRPCGACTGACAAPRRRYDSGALASAAREGDRRLLRADQVGNHRRARRDERRDRRDDARPAGARRRRGHDRPVPAALRRSTRRSTAGCIRTSSAGSASRARRSASARSSPARSSARRYRADEQRHAAETGRGAVAY